MIAALQKQDPKAVVVVCEYNGWDDGARPVTTVEARSTSQIRFSDDGRPGGPTTRFVVVSGLER